MTESTERGSLFAELASRYLDDENDDPAEWTDEMMLDRIDHLIGEGWAAAGHETMKLESLAEAARFEQERLATYVANGRDPFLWHDLTEARQVVAHTLDDLHKGRECPCGSCRRHRQRVGARRMERANV